MFNRRRFVRAAAASALAGCGLPAVAADVPASRRQVMVDGRAVRVIDMHAHCVFPEVAELIKGTPLDRRLPRAQVLGPQRIEAMDQRGIDVQVVSVTGYWWYDGEQDLADKVVHLHDAGLAKAQQNEPRFVGLSSVSLQFPELAAQQLEHAVTNLGLKGASIGGHVRAEVPSSADYDPFWAKAQELGVPVFMHPGGAENIVQEATFEGRGDLTNIIGNPLETTLFLSRMIFDGTLDRFPDLKLVLAHAGGYVPSYLGRTEAACEYRPMAECANRRRPSEYLKEQVLVDSLVFSDEGIRHLVAEMGAGQIVYGSDLPFNWPDTIDLIVESHHLSAEQKEAMLGGNLKKLLNL
jgi:aminocarboxymuconate-semialdehyde decarboxylase